MGTNDTPEREIRSRFDVPEEWKVGLPEVEDPDDPTSTITIPNTVVARIRIPVGLIFGVLQAINGAMTNYEESWGTTKASEWQGQEGEEDE